MKRKDIDKEIENHIAKFIEEKCLDNEASIKECMNDVSMYRVGLLDGVNIGISYVTEQLKRLRLNGGSFDNETKIS